MPKGKQPVKNLHALFDTQDGGITVVDDRSGLRISFIRSGRDDAPLLTMETYTYDTNTKPTIEQIPGRAMVHVLGVEEDART